MHVHAFMSIYVYIRVLVRAQFVTNEKLSLVLRVKTLYFFAMEAPRRYDVGVRIFLTCWRTRG